MQGSTNRAKARFHYSPVTFILRARNPLGMIATPSYRSARVVRTKIKRFRRHRISRPYRSLHNPKAPSVYMDFETAAGSVGFCVGRRGRELSSTYRARSGRPCCVHSTRPARRLANRPAAHSPGSEIDPGLFSPAGWWLYALRMDVRDAKRPLKIATDGNPIVEPDLDMGNAGIDASGGRDPRSGLPTVLHEAAGTDLPEG